MSEWIAACLGAIAALVLVVVGCMVAEARLVPPREHPGPFIWTAAVVLSGTLLPLGVVMVLS